MDTLINGSPEEACAYLQTAFATVLDELVRQFDARQAIVNTDTVDKDAHALLVAKVEKAEAAFKACNAEKTEHSKNGKLAQAREKETRIAEETARQKLVAAQEEKREKETLVQKYKDETRSTPTAAQHNAFMEEKKSNVFDDSESDSDDEDALTSGKMNAESADEEEKIDFEDSDDNDDFCDHADQVLQNQAKIREATEAHRKAVLKVTECEKAFGIAKRNKEKQRKAVKKLVSAFHILKKKRKASIKRVKSARNALEEATQKAKDEKDDNLLRTHKMALEETRANLILKTRRRNNFCSILKTCCEVEHADVNPYYELTSGQEIIDRINSKHEVDAAQSQLNLNDVQHMDVETVPGEQSEKEATCAVTEAIKSHAPTVDIGTANGGVKATKKRRRGSKDDTEQKAAKPATKKQKTKETTSAVSKIPSSFNMPSTDAMYDIGKKFDAAKKNNKQPRPHASNGMHA